MLFLFIVVKLRMQYVYVFVPTLATNMYCHATLNSGVASFYSLLF